MIYLNVDKTSKFSINQKVYFMNFNKIYTSRITTISMRVHVDRLGKQEIKITYDGNGLSINTPEEDLFASKEELLKSL